LEAFNEKYDMQIKNKILKEKALEDKRNDKGIEQCTFKPKMIAKDKSSYG
jgi:hypothetical protein